MAVPGKKKPVRASSAATTDPIRVFAERVRDHKELESRWAVLQEARVEYFRAKDFVALLAAHPELKKVLEEEDADSEELGNLLLQRKLVMRCDRVVKSLRPGKKKLSKWPARIELHPEQAFSQDDSFFAWTFERRRPMWQTVVSFFVPIVTVACCLFPVFPHWCKLVVLYFCLAFLGLIFGVLFARWAIFGLLWIVLGKRFWFFPNILAEEATFSELFVFFPNTSEDKEPPPKWTARLGFALVTMLSIWFLVHHAPDEAARTRYQRRVVNKIDELLEWQPSLAALSGKASNSPIPEAGVFNETGTEGSMSSEDASNGSWSVTSGEPETVGDKSDHGSGDDTRAQEEEPGDFDYQQAKGEPDATQRAPKDEL